MTEQTVEQYKSMLEYVPCNLCGAENYTEIYPARYEDAQPEHITETFRSSGDEILVDALVQCNQCGLQYLNPRLKQDVIIDGYSAGTDETFVSQIAARERTFESALKRIEKLAPDKGKILDIGTAGGSFLGVARQRGWEVSGCEPNRWLSEWGSQHYGITIQPGTVFDMKLAENTFDVVTLWDVLEHTPDPKTVLQECSRILKPGGVLIVNYPDISSLIARLLGRKWVFLLSVHLYYFTPATIREMLNQTGFNMGRPKWHWQSLELGYILFRMKPYLPAVARLGARIAKALHIEHWQIPYWMGQILVAARKRA